MPTVEVPGTELNYERAGAGEPLLLIQGMSANHMAWGRPFASLLEQSFDIVSFDNRGMGLSRAATEAFSTAELAADTVGLLDALGIESAHVFGISMGGMIAQELALAHPGRLRSLTIGCSYCGGEGSQLMDPADFQGLVEAMSSGDQDRVFRAMYELNLSPGFRAEQSRYGDFTAMAAALPAPRETIGLQVQAIAAHDTRDRLPGIEIPTLVIHGTVDRVLGYPNGPLIASQIPGARLEAYEDVGHMFWWEQPERTAELLRQHALAPA
ncbi:MAG TPA: alpha/beta fold hydrolase [Solirubrobacterales bacterium]|jgi:pimeloyl-ACP methyl ester carboxylesterase|nr:alpha/beta fold hydrolase [Solirubrobacterales bacterium]